MLHPYSGCNHGGFRTRMSTTKKIFLAALFSCIFGAVNMSAASLSFTCTVAEGNMPQIVANACGTQIPDFNPAWGTLTSVTLQLTAATGGLYPEVFNNSLTTT